MNPTRDLGTRGECKRNWERARKSIMADTDFDLRSRFEKTAYRIKMDGKYCYKESLFSTKGWCRLVDPTSHLHPPSFTWGICSSSCDLDFITVHNLNLSILPSYPRFRRFISKFRPVLGGSYTSV